jgi:hypothetical protein
VDEEEVSAGGVSAGRMAENAGARMLGAVTSGDGALGADKACGCVGACRARSANGVSDCRGGSSSDSMAGWLGMDGDGVAEAMAMNSIRRFAEFAFF